MIVEVLVAQHQAKDPLPDQRLDPVLDLARIATIGEAFAEPTDQAQAAIDCCCTTSLSDSQPRCTARV